MTSGSSLPFQTSSQISKLSAGKEIRETLSLSGGRRGSVLVSGSTSLLLLVLVDSRVDIVLLAGAVNSNLDGNGAAINFLAVHLVDSLGLELLGGQVDETEAASLAALVAGLELFDHKARDWAQGNLG